MLALAIVALLGSAGTAYVIGYAFTAPRDAFLRTKRGVVLLIVAGITIVPLPPQLIGMDEALGPLGGMMGNAATALAWPAGLGKGVYLGLWIASTALGFFGGIRIWQFGTSEWRGGANRAFDASAASRVCSLLPMADRVEQALDTLAQAGLTAKDLSRVVGEVREVGRRFSDSLPPSDGEVYRLVSSRVPAAVAAAITGLLLEGAGRRAARG
ncbi:MAG: hypothetical protein JW733_07860 [Coriobacteriia bacterium]|nr:hypothetical protein [Coriobacteriia bacterium]MBN2840701.1 hypothetical protein [Coriobacteriia bacterium]